MRSQNGILESQCEKLNRRFFSFHQKKRPYVILKWAESADGFIAPKDVNTKYWLTDVLSKQRVHQWRSQEQSVMIGIKTALIDNPKLNTRLWAGNNPTPVIIDPKQKLSQSGNHLATEKNTINIVSINTGAIDTNTPLDAVEILNRLYEKELQSVIIEGGTKTLQHFIDANLWDEARIFTTKKKLFDGVKAPKIKKKLNYSSTTIKEDSLVTFYRE